MNSPTFNTLDNRFDQLNPDSSRVHYGGENGDREDRIANVFMDNSWPGLRNDVDSDVGEQATGLDAIPRLASPLVNMKIDDFEADKVKKHITDTDVKEAGAPAFSQESFASINRRDQTKRKKQPSQGRVSDSERMLRQSHGQKESKENNKGSISPSRAFTPKQDSANRQRRNEKSPTRRNNRSTTLDEYENPRPLSNGINVVSSNTIIDRSQSPAINKRRNSNNRVKVHDGYKKMNKVPYREMKQKIITNYQPIVAKNRKTENGEKHSAHQVHRMRSIPPISQHIRFQTDLNRLNLKTREEIVSKRSKLLDSGVAVRDSFDVSVDLKTLNEAKAAATDFNAIKTQTKDFFAKIRNNTIDSSFLKQSEIMRMKPDGFRRISIQTDVEFGGGTKAVGQGLHPLSPPRAVSVSNTIVEDEKGTDEDDSPVRHFNESNMSDSFLPQHRVKQKEHKEFKCMQIRDSVLQSRNESSRLNDVLSNHHNTGMMAPSIKKALNDRAKFYRRKLTFYENLGVLANSMTSTEIRAKLKEEKIDLNSSHGTSIMNAISSRQGYRAPSSMRQTPISPQTQKEQDPLSEKISEKKEVQQEQLPEILARDIPAHHEARMKIFSGAGELRKSPDAITDFRPKDMSPRRSRILESLDPTQGRQTSQLPKAIQGKKRQHSETVATILPDTHRKSIFSSMLAMRVKNSNRDNSISSVGMSPREGAPSSRSQFKRINVPTINGNNQVWRRINDEFTPPPRDPWETVNLTHRVEPDLTDVRKIPVNSKNNAKTARNSRKHSKVHARGALQDIMEKKQTAILEPIKPPKARQNSKPTSKVRLANKLSVSPLTQELRNLGPVKSQRMPVYKDPAYPKYSNHNIILPPKLVGAGSTHMDPNKPSFINKQKAMKLVLLQHTISQVK